MGLFKSKEEKEEKKKAKDLKKEASAVFMGESLQPIGKIPLGATVGLSLKPDNKVLNIHYNKTDITLPYDRIRGFRLESETTLAKNGSSIGRGLVGGALFGGAGAVVGGISAKGNTKTKWIGTLSYEDKDGSLQELNFIEWGLPNGYYTGDMKHDGGARFEQQIQKIAYRSGNDITEL